MNPPMATVSTLLGHGQVEMALLCLASLLRLSAEPVNLRLHDDGTLCPEDFDRLASGLGDCEVISRQRADERVAEVLAKRPALAAFRRDNPLALKLVDAVLWAGSKLTFCDTDVLFLRPFTDLFALPDGSGAVFMTDRQNAYSVRSWHLLRRRRLALPRRANTGIVVYHTAAWDPDLLEWYLARPEHRFAPVWVEQTAWALLGWRAGCRLVAASQIAIPRPDQPADLSPANVALHFVSPVRQLLPAYREIAPDRTGEPPVAVRTVPADRCGWASMAVTEGRRLLARWRGPQRSNP